MPGIDTLDGLLEAVTEFDTHAYEPAIDIPALDWARRSIDEAGLLLLGEMHGVKENPLIILGLMRALGLSNLALEWPADLQPQLDGCWRRTRRRAPAGRHRTAAAPRAGPARPAGRAGCAPSATAAA
ncbi:hypothetical protein [Nonomuraea sp. B5E05]|uniref:hypothetical protein n=1 Tax=Nonomuraea sp. B5E05 TaxID=3153569 RepID=UPI003261A282